MTGTRGAFGSITRGRAALRKRGGVLVLSGLLLAACTAPEPGLTGAAAALLPAPARPSTAAAEPERYQGLGSTELVRLLGMPDFRRRDVGAEVWQYRAGTCILDLFLYDDGGAFHVLYAETHSRATGRTCNDARVAERAAARL